MALQIFITREQETDSLVKFLGDSGVVRIGSAVDSGGASVELNGANRERRLTALGRFQYELLLAAARSAGLRLDLLINPLNAPAGSLVFLAYDLVKNQYSQSRIRIRHLIDEFDEAFGEYSFDIKVNDALPRPVTALGQRTLYALSANGPQSELHKARLFQSYTHGEYQGICLREAGSLVFELSRPRRAMGLWLQDFAILFGNNVDQIFEFSGQPPANLSQGGGGGAMRSDSVREVDYRWSGNINLGRLLGLEFETYVEFEKIPALIEKGFRATNVPRTAYSEAIVQNPALNAGSELIYLKRFLKDRPRKNAPRFIEYESEVKPDDGFPAIKLAQMQPLIPGFQDTPRARRNGIDLIPRKKRKGARGADGSTSGVALENAGGDRENAASVMFISATRYTRLLLGELEPEELEDSEKRAFELPPANPLDPPVYFYVAPNARINFKASWDSTRCGPSGYDQEWCHLHGHGDGGPEETGNFVSGSKHCNTEQLAIESGQRKGGIDILRAKITAYLVHPQTHVARYIRYKIYAPTQYPLQPGGAYRKIFDHIFDAQSKSFNYHEFKILKATVERVVCAAQPYGDGNEYFTLEALSRRINEEMERKGLVRLSRYRFLNKRTITISDYLSKQATRHVKTGVVMAAQPSGSIPGPSSNTSDSAMSGT